MLNEYEQAFEQGKEAENNEWLDIIEDIRAEIVEEKVSAYADFERYKIEYLGVDEKTVMEDLPYDDFRYGMERALEIILKHLSEKDKG